RTSPTEAKMGLLDLLEALGAGCFPIEEGNGRHAESIAIPPPAFKQYSLTRLLLRRLPRRPILHRLFGGPRQIVHVALRAAEAEDRFVEVHLAVEEAAGVDVELDGSLLHPLDELREDLGIADRSEDLRLDG